MGLSKEEAKFNKAIDRALDALQEVIDAAEPGSQIIFIKPLIQQPSRAADVRWDPGGTRMYHEVGSRTVPLKMGSEPLMFRKITNAAGNLT